MFFQTTSPRGASLKDLGPQERTSIFSWPTFNHHKSLKAWCFFSLYFKRGSLILIITPYEPTSLLCLGASRDTNSMVLPLVQASDL